MLACFGCAAVGVAGVATHMALFVQAAHSGPRALARLTAMPFGGGLATAIRETAPPCIRAGGRLLAIIGSCGRASTFDSCAQSTLAAEVGVAAIGGRYIGGGGVGTRGLVRT